MPYCDKCGAEVANDETCCLTCGATQKIGVRRNRIRERRYRRDEDFCFAGDQGRDPLGVVEFGLFLLIVGLIFSLNPDVFTELISWIDHMADLEAYIAPPGGLTTSAITFFGLIGGANILTAAIRLVMDKTMGRIMGDIASGVALLVFAYLLTQLAAGAMAWTNVLGVEAIVVGALIIVYSLIRRTM